LVLAGNHGFWLAAFCLFDASWAGVVQPFQLEIVRRIGERIGIDTRPLTSDIGSSSCSNLMDAAMLKKLFGDEYPAVALVQDIKIPFSFETRFQRHYHSKEHKMGTTVSRFMDGSASMTATRLASEWPEMTEDERVDFCSAANWLSKQADFADMLRFVIRHGKPDEWQWMSLSIATGLPQEEAYVSLAGALEIMSVEKSINIVQGIALTKHPQAEARLRQHLGVVWKQAGLWDDDDWLNWTAYAARTCIEHLLELCVPPGDFEPQVRKLSEHICERNRDDCRRFLSKYYPWLAQEP
jgi:hypothetical protein